MKYWAYFVSKIAAASSALYGLWLLVDRWLPEPQTFMRQPVTRFPQDLTWTSALLVFWLLAIGAVSLIVWDQRRRCHVCLAVLRMPVEHGSWSMATLFSPPHTESICPFGHGTLDTPEVQLTGHQAPSWRKHGSIWEELERIDRGAK